MNILEMTKKDFRSLKYGLYKDNPVFNGFVIIPTGEKHISGFMCMKYALTCNNVIVGCVGGYCDIVHLQGIGGYGEYNEDYDKRVATRQGPSIGWDIDCLPCGFLRVFTTGKLKITDFIGSDFCIYKEVEK